MLAQPTHDHLAHKDLATQRFEPCFRDVLALATSTGPWSPSVIAGVELAAQWNGNVTGCYVPSSLRLQDGNESEPTVIGLLTDVEYDCTEDYSAFQTFAKRLGARHASWAVTRTGIAATLRKLSNWHDLAVLERDIVEPKRVFDILGEAMLGCRIPCLILPPRWDSRLSFERVVIAWNGSPEATRALHAALPLIRLAKEVTLINGEVRSPFDGEVSVAEPDPIVYLMHHGVAAKPQYICVSSELAGETLLQKTHEAHAGLLVMGAYGHSRIRERVLGGATRCVIANADIPVFMQH
jgi:nucleotide-binding universal stress UspA family protein